MSSSSSFPPSKPLGKWLASPLGQLQLLLGLAIALGGGGVAYGLRNLAIQLCALAILLVNREAVIRFVRQAPIALVILVGLSLLLPLVQLVPLPPAIWQSLPGRDIVTEAWALAGLPADSWSPVSLDSMRTWVAFLGMLAPATIIVMGSTMPREDKAKLAWSVAVAALLALLIGVAQLSAANSTGLLYPITPKPDVLYATFANRNSTALLFVLTILLLASVPFSRVRGGLLLVVAGICLLALGALLTQSRSGMALLGVALAFVLVRIACGFWQARKTRYGGNRRPLIIALVLTASIGLALAASLAQGGRVSDSIDRLTNSDTDRPQIWDDAKYAAEFYWPLGAGSGSFDEVFQLHESLEYVSPRRAGRAHNDYLELAIESGILGAILAFCWLLWCASAAIFAQANRRWTALGAGLAIGCIAAQSILDYPLRNQSLLCVAAVLVVLLARSRRGGA